MLGSNRLPLRRLILVVDVLLVVGAMALAAGLHAALRNHAVVLRRPPAFSEYALIVYLAVPLWLGLVALFGLHRTFERTWTRLTLVVDLVKLHVVGFLGLSSALFFTQTAINRSLVVLFLGSSFVLFYGFHGVLGYWRAYQHRTGQTKKRLLIVGDSPEVEKFVTTAASEPLPPVIARIMPRIAIPELERALHEEPLDHVLSFPPYDESLPEALRACDLVGVSAELAIDMVQPLGTHPRVVDVFGRPFISFDPAPKSSELIAVKHAADWIIAAIALVLLVPVLVLISLAIALTMGGPVFFTQTRAGLHGRHFRMVKFRTMVADAEAKKAQLLEANEMTGPVFKITRDPRVTRLGYFLRKTSLDELPQLFNVVTGSMSLVGPRPLPIAEQQNIRGWHRRRLSMKPGITGIWQISGRNDIDFEEWMRLDENYVNEWSIRLDLAILVKTVPAVLFGRGAK